MKLRALFLIGFGVAIGYAIFAPEGQRLLGQLAGRTRQLADDADLDDLGARIADRGTDVGEAAANTVGDVVDAAADKAKGVADSVSSKVR